MIIITIIILIIGSHLGNRHSGDGLGGGSGEGWWTILFEHFIDLSPFEKATACWRSTLTCWSSWRGSCQRATWWERSSTRSSWADRRSWSTQATSTHSAQSSRTWNTLSSSPLCIPCRSISLTQKILWALSLVMFMVKFVLKSTLDTLPILTGNFK